VDDDLDIPDFDAYELGARALAVCGPFGNKTVIAVPTEVAEHWFPIGLAQSGRTDPVTAVELDLDTIRKKAPELAESGTAATALQMAYELVNPYNSATAKSMCAGRLSTRSPSCGRWRRPRRRRGRSMQSALSVPTASPRGAQEPRISWWPAYTTSAADEVLKVAKVAGIVLDPWQEFQLRHGLGESPDWKCPHCTHRAADPVPCPAHPWADLIHPWAAFEVCSVVPRQNGKTELFVVIMLGGLYVLEEPLQIYSAHQFDTSLEVMRRLAFVIKESDDLRREVKHRGSRLSGIIEANGKEGVELANGCRVRFKARTGGGGRGFTCNRLFLDEAMILPEVFLGATVPTLSAVPNPQIWLAGSAPDQQDPKHDGIVLAKRRKRALAATTRRSPTSSTAPRATTPRRSRRRCSTTRGSGRSATRRSACGSPPGTSRPSGSRWAPASSRPSASASATGPTPTRMPTARSRARRGWRAGRLD
jgi:hypothetical protein